LAFDRAWIPSEKKGFIHHSIGVFWIWHLCSVVPSVPSCAWWYVLLLVSCPLTGISTHLCPTVYWGLSYDSAVGSVGYLGAAWLFCSGRCQFRPTMTTPLLLTWSAPSDQCGRAGGSKEQKGLPQASSNFNGLKSKKSYFLARVLATAERCLVSAFESLEMPSLLTLPPENRTGTCSNLVFHTTTIRTAASSLFWLWVWPEKRWSSWQALWPKHRKKKQGTVLLLWLFPDPNPFALCSGVHPSKSVSSNNGDE